MVGTAAATIVSAGLLLGGGLPRLRTVSREQREASSIIQGMLSELRGRLSAQDARLADFQVRLDVLEGRVMRGREYGLKPSSGEPLAERGDVMPAEAPGHGRDVRDVASHARSMASRGVEGGRRRLTATEEAVLRALVEAPRRAAEVQGAIGRSREHTARLLKRLYEAGFLTREGLEGPFRYRVTEAGRSYSGA